jgi:hypothetical protein
MSRWNVKASTLFILCCLIAIMLLIVVLPHVDLPATAFHRGTGPVALHARAMTTPHMVAVASIVPASNRPQCADHFECNAPTINSDPNFRSILLRSIRC